ncbi:NAD(P)-dependent oxidoreductase [Pseudoalteromonas sp. MMG013]|uniref:NAD-dependent epimerase/dehydratase family protein n=1 Tax=Pseudoalteromonas sp. MMG013 TaxID=2822687 RepID=UPI001B388B68|nr:NAD(P)-dependent oxidoreductase [Pseudoalteromonas sp. MMG013]MBQ4863999.1 NAD(P)-dependent oxidoreductase [Pseudoalteromonas sp. MMG013]
MKILITGSAGRVGRAIYIKLMQLHHVIGVDITPCSTVDIVADIRDLARIRHALINIDVVIHCAALHAPHVNIAADEDFNSINIMATEQLALEGIKQGLRHFIFTSTTALYGFASTKENQASWIDETITAQPKSIYHTSKIAAEKKLAQLSHLFNLPVTVLRMSRCFPETADLMSIYRSTRGIDVRDVAQAHACAVELRLPGFKTYIISGSTPFTPKDCVMLYTDPGTLIHEKMPDLATEFRRRQWSMPCSLDRVYDSALAQTELQWQPMHGYQSVLTMLDNELPEVLPVINLSK